MANDKILIEFPGRIVFIGFGSIGQGTLPLVLRHIGIFRKRASRSSPVTTAAGKSRNHMA